MATYSRDGVWAGSNQALVLARGELLQVRREFGIGRQRGLNRDDKIAGEVGDSGDCKRGGAGLACDGLEGQVESLVQSRTGLFRRADLVL